MDREAIIANLAVQVAARQCKDGSPSDIVATYFSVLPEVRKCYDEDEKKRVPTPKLQTFSAKGLGI